ncbi:MAG: insulinase family protein, partial [Paraprevotella sp.]|nr:insulinase family protein [Paraprevotella sp.]
LDRILQIYKERFADAADLDVILTRNIDIAKLRPLLCTYLASLPSTHHPEKVGDTRVRIRPVKETRIFVKEQATPSVTTTILVSADIPYTADNDLRLDALCQMLRMRYTESVREEKGGTYGVNVSGSLQRYPEEKAIINISFRTDPEKYKGVIPIIYEELQNMAEKGPEEADLDKVKEFEVKTYGQVKIINDYWQEVMYNKLFNGIDIDKNYTDRVRALTVDDIRQLAQQIVGQNHSIEVTMSSKAIDAAQ